MFSYTLAIVGGATMGLLFISAELCVVLTLFYFIDVAEAQWFSALAIYFVASRFSWASLVYYRKIRDTQRDAARNVARLGTFSSRHPK